MQFDMDYGQSGYKDPKPLEPDSWQPFWKIWSGQSMWWMASPLWWGAVPAKLKAVFDRALLPGRAFDTRKVNVFGLPAPMLAGKTARVLLTSDTPALLLRLFYGNAVKKFISRQILGFVGIKPTRFTTFAPATAAPEAKVKSWLRTAGILGGKAA